MTFLRRDDEQDSSWVIHFSRDIDAGRFFTEASVIGLQSLTLTLQVRIKILLIFLLINQLEREQHPTESTNLLHYMGRYRRIEF